jgi:hypothetical protein
MRIKAATRRLKFEETARLGDRVNELRAEQICKP